MELVAIIVAGGTGSRMGGTMPKQFMLLNGKQILLHSIDAFLVAYPEMRIVLVSHPNFIEHTQLLLEQAGYSSEINVTAGGITRFHSVSNGLHFVNRNSIVLVHDAVRCLVTPELIRKTVVLAKESGSAIPVIPIKDSIRKLDRQSGISSVVNRDELVIVQTPQVFKAELLLDAFSEQFRETFTDEASVVEAKGYSVVLIPGDESNIKITFPEDLAYAEWKLANRE
jgi:2-C-methyl-D-erythritol 4-phosphate cytidylyltransferase